MQPTSPHPVSAPTARARAAIVVWVVVVVLVASADPADAHSLTGAQATNYQTRIFGLAPRYAGIEARVIDLGGRVELRNESAHEVTVLGYQNEPYLRIGPSGVLRNQRSPATFLNQTRTLPGPVPASYDATAAPSWVRIGAEPTARWHDHRTHWMATTAPPVVQRDPQHRHVVIPHWVVPLRIDGHRVDLTGDVVWVPGPQPWPWLLLALALLTALVGASLTRLARAGVAVALVVAGGSAALLAAGAWRFSTGSVWARLGSTAYEVGAAFLTGVVVVALARRSRLYGVSPMLLLAGLFVAIGGGFANLTSLWRSQLPTVLPANVARLLIVVCAGLGTGLVVVAALHLGRRDRALHLRQGTLRMPRMTQSSRPSRTTSKEQSDEITTPGPFNR
jgi:hypothetical protein